MPSKDSKQLRFDSVGGSDSSSKEQSIDDKGDQKTANEQHLSILRPNVNNKQVDKAAFNLANSLLSHIKKKKATIRIAAKRTSKLGTSIEAAQRDSPRQSINVNSLDSPMNSNKQSKQNEPARYKHVKSKFDDTQATKTNMRKQKEINIVENDSSN